MTRKRITTAAISAMLAVSMVGAAAEAKTNARGPRYVAKSQTACPVRRTVNGDIVDCHGWRLRPNVGWDNTCLNLDYLPSMYACSPNRR